MTASHLPALSLEEAAFVRRTLMHLRYLRQLLRWRRSAMSLRDPLRAAIRREQRALALIRTRRKRCRVQPEPQPDVRKCRACGCDDLHACDMEANGYRQLKSKPAYAGEGKY